MAGKCPVCGAPLQGNTCTYCGYEAQVNSQPDGGTTAQPHIVINNVVQNQNSVGGFAVGNMISPKSRTVALLLCIFLGVFGAHAFYAGRIARGVVFLLTCGLLGFGALFDLIMIAIGSFKDHDGMAIKNW